jgi:hypothetical protein
MRRRIQRALAGGLLAEALLQVGDPVLVNSKANEVNSVGVRCP